MTIRLDDNFTIELDTIGNHTLVETQIVKSGKNKGSDYRITHGYFGNLAKAVMKYMQLNALEDEETIDLIELLDRYEKLLKDVETKFKKDKVIK